MSGLALQPASARLVLLALWLGGVAAVAAAAPTGPAERPPKPLSTPLRLPPPIVYERVVGADSAVTFRHDTHVELAGNRCLGCHPEPFRMLKPARRIAHADMESGGSCGRCHDGKAAFSVRDPSACQTCHAGSTKFTLAGQPGPAGPATGAPGRPLPRPLSFTRGASSPGVVRFLHATHLKGSPDCQACHPKPYRMKATGGAPGGAMHEAASCGGCHDGRRAFGVDDAETCSRCHRGQEVKP